MTINTADSNDADALHTLIHRIMMGVHTSAPCVVIAYNTSGSHLYARVQIAVQQVEDIAGERKHVDHTILENVPVVLPYAQKLGLSVTLPIQAGDEGMLHFCERSIDGWQELGGIQPTREPMMPRTHDYTDAVFVPGAISVPNSIQNYSTTAIEIRNSDGSVSASVSPDTVQLKHGSTTVILPSDGKIHFNGDIVHTGNYTQTGDQNVTGTTTVTGNITSSGGDVIAQTVSLHEHEHDKTQGAAPGNYSGKPKP